MIWMFLCMYALPLVFNRYAITSFDAFYNNPDLGTTIQEQYGFDSSDVFVGNVSQVGYNTSAYIANIVTFCGFPSGGEFVVTKSPQCWLYRDIWSAVKPSQVVPGDLRLAICGLGTTLACPFFDQVNSARGFLSEALTNTINDDYRKSLSVLFNAFVMCQVSDDVCGG